MILVNILKRNLIPLLFLTFTLLLIVFSNSNITAVKTGLRLWVNNVIPSLFPFFIAVELLNHTPIPRGMGKLLEPMMRPLFNVPGIGSYALFMGIISGYPIGAKIVTDLRNDHLCTKVEGERLLTFTNNSGPLFIIGSVGIALFKDTGIGILLLVTHLMACISVAFVFRFWKGNKRKSSNVVHPYNEQVHLNNLGAILSQSIMSAIRSAVIIRWIYCSVLCYSFHVATFEIVCYSLLYITTGLPCTTYKFTVYYSFAVWSIGADIWRFTC